MRLHQKHLVQLLRDVIGEPETGAEIGVYRGETSAVLLNAFPSLQLLCVDPWAEASSESTWHKQDKVMGRTTRSEWVEIFAEAMHYIREAGFDRTRILKTTSARAAALTPDRSLDFVFIDGDHTRTAEDIRLWLPKCRNLICGHDYKGAGDRRHKWGVTEAVHAAFGEENIIARRGLIWGYRIPSSVADACRDPVVASANRSG